ncbi:sensor histidine kinase [Paenibacillus protaetiae]|uniref:histidine kinase n=1 Tax=Paenibacillus protaetiae TaxID=2509456 RepID=A0A4P6EWE7_9BACL|nr:HAMP domain-containing sensor histidine kinase [Paenibacillus protaetiae]QAY66513.1 sensor histidine kinase [Paenibacillus protaetiae]
MNILRKTGRALLRFIRIIDGPAAILSSLLLCWTAAYFGLHWLYNQLNWQPHTLVNQLFTSLGGFLLFTAFVFSVAPFIRRKELQMYQELQEALRRIARGDFHVRLQSRRTAHEHITQIIADINEMAVNLKEMEDMRQEFIANVSHEIQSPLTSISGFARAMAADELPRSEQLQYLDIIEAESVRMSRLSDDLLRLASFDSKRHPFHPELYRLDKQLRRLILTFERQWMEKELEVSADLDEIWMNADPSLLSQVWVNLIQNAVKFTPPGGTIAVSLKLQNDHVVVSVKDSGIGISEADQNRIFERFFKSDRSRTRSAGGSGLGLSIVSKIVEMHSGTIAVSSQPGEWSEFTVTLPLAPQQTE